MKDLQTYIIKEDKYPGPDFDHMTPQVALLSLMSGKTMEEVFPKINKGAGDSIHGVYNQHKSEFPDVDEKLLNLIKHW